MSSDAKELIEGMPASFKPDKAGAAKADIQLALAGDGGGEWLVQIADGKCEVSESAESGADVTVTMEAGDFVALTKGQLNPIQAFMQGKIKVVGNVGLVMQMMTWFDL